MMNPVEEEHHLGHAQQGPVPMSDKSKGREKRILCPPIPNWVSQGLKEYFGVRNTFQKCPGERSDGVLWVQRLLFLCEERV